MRKLSVGFGILLATTAGGWIYEGGTKPPVTDCNKDKLKPTVVADPHSLVCQPPKGEGPVTARTGTMPCRRCNRIRTRSLLDSTAHAI